MKLLLVCIGNLCRLRSAEAVLQQLGTGAFGPATSIRE